MIRGSLIYFFVLTVTTLSNAQSILTNTPVPPLQWIDLTNLLNGARPPPLKDATIGYDESSRSLIIFGGESSGGFPQAQTYLLQLETLTWSTPSPPSGLRSTPPARSGAIGGVDVAPSNRRGFVIMGGKGVDGQPLSDVWEYDFTNQFWSPVSVSSGGPSPRWGASGGIDYRVPAVQDPVVPGPNNTFYLAGGFDGSSISPLSDVWMLNISGTLSSNLPGDARGSWMRVNIADKLPSRIHQGSAVISQQIVSAGGCDTTSIFTNACAQPGSYVIDAVRHQTKSPVACPAPRLGPVLAPNSNDFSTSFSSQAFLLLGTFNSSLWHDGNGLANGEVAVLDINTGSWSRILPSGDPGTSGKESFPTPREGAAGVSYFMALVGNDRNSSSDIIIYGGRDTSGNYLAETWLLRAYDGEITPSSPRWPGFGNGQLQTGPNANGAGVTTKFMTECVSAIAIPSSLPPTSSGSPTSTSPSQSTTANFLYDTSILHKLLAPLSLALLLPAVLLFRLSAPTFNLNHSPERHIAWTYLAIVTIIAAYGVGMAGIASSFTTISSVSSLGARSSKSLTLQTGHGKAGLALFIGLYGVIPLLLILSWFVQYSRTFSDVISERSTAANTHELLEKMPSQNEPARRSRPQSEHTASPPTSPRPRVNSWGPSSTRWPRSHEGRLSDDSESMSSSVPQRAFEVLNRPPRGRQSNGAMQSVPTSEHSHLFLPRLADIDWLQRRRSLNAVGELDYAITQASRPLPPTPHTTDPLMEISIDTRKPPLVPHSFSIVVRFLFHVFVIGLCIVSLIALWFRAHRATFAVFLTWTIAFYIALLVLAWMGKPEHSTLTILFSRLRGQQHAIIPAVMSNTHPPTPVDRYPFTPGPYFYHQPPFRTATIDGGHRSVETDDDGPDEDEDTRQRRIEEEMERRDVSIVTVPKRKLWIANPS